MTDPFAAGTNREHLKALWDAYFEASGLPRLTPSPDRMKTLREIDRCETKITAADIRGVMLGIKRAIASGKSSYTEASLDWKNAMKNVDTLEERVNRYRQALARRKGAARQAAEAAPRAIVKTLADGSTVAVLATAPATVSEAVPIKGALSQAVQAALRSPMPDGRKEQS